MENTNENFYSRTEALIGDKALQKLKDASVAVFGLGGVGGYVAEALTRAGIGKLILVDSDVIMPSNINRQIIALNSNVGRGKAEEFASRFSDINPNGVFIPKTVFYSAETEKEFNFLEYDYIADCIDSFDSKVLLIENSFRQKVKIISSMGAAYRLNPSLFKVADIYSTSVCPLAKKLRKALREKNITSLKTVYSDELPIKLLTDGVKPNISYVPAACGLLIASEIVKDLIGL